ncbi:MAG: hypothetical protein JWR42_1062 [Marmoricola sp.]|nr:hypothetical protein [Marmoricola sp.]
MTTPASPEYVDPRDPAAVACVLDAVVGATGLPGLLDLLGRLPGVGVEPGAAKGLFRAAVPASTWLGPENRLVLVESPAGAHLEHHHVVGGITLARDVLGPDRAGSVLARLVGPAAASAGPAGVAEATAVLSAHAELYP